MRNLRPEVVNDERHFDNRSSLLLEEGSRSLNPVEPYIISGGDVTERCYFSHLANCSKYEFNVLPKFFGNESSYAKEFPKRINEILSGCPDAKIYCVFDVDTIFSNLDREKNVKRKCAFANKKTYDDFVKKYENSENVVLCPSMPCFEYWFLLHFENDFSLYKTCGKIIKKLEPYIRSYFPAQAPKDDESKSQMSRVKYLRKVNLGHILKNEDYLDNDEWVKRLCDDKKLENAVKNAEENIKIAQKQGLLEKQSYSYVFLPFKDYDFKDYEAD